MKRFTIPRIISLKLFLDKFWLQKFQEGLEKGNPVTGGLLTFTAQKAL